MKKLFLPLVFLLLATSMSFAQRGGGGGGGGGGNGGGGNGNNANANANATNPNLGRVAIWACKTPAGTYEVALRSIVSVSSCEYIVDNVARVTEVNIDTGGNMAVRFYYIEPLLPNSPIGLGQSAIDKAQQLASDAADRTGQDAWKKVVKNYPTTTHSHTIEYRVDSKDDIDKIFASADQAFRNFKPATYTVGGSNQQDQDNDVTQ